MTQLELTAPTFAVSVALWARARGTFIWLEAHDAFPVAASDLDVALTRCAEWDGHKTWTVKGFDL